MSSDYDNSDANSENDALISELLLQGGSEEPGADSHRNDEGGTSASGGSNDEGPDLDDETRDGGIAVRIDSADKSSQSGAAEPTTRAIDTTSMSVPGVAGSPIQTPSSLTGTRRSIGGTETERTALASAPRQGRAAAGSTTSARRPMRLSSAGAAVING